MCGSGVANASRNYKEGIDVDLTSIPERLIIPADVAERFIERTYRGSGLMSFDNQLNSFVSEVPGRGPVVAFTARPVGPIALRSRDMFSPPLLLIDEAALRADAERRAAQEAAERSAALARKQAEDEESAAVEEARRKQVEEDRAAKTRAAKEERERQEAENREELNAARGKTSVVLGASPGTDFKAIVEALAEGIGADATYFARRSSRQAEYKRGFDMQMNDWSPYHEATLLVGRAGNELVAIYHEPGAEPGQVTGLSRSRAFPVGQGVAFDKLTASLEDAYGEIPANQKRLSSEGSAVTLLPLQVNQPGATRLDPNSKACLAQHNSKLILIRTALQGNATQRKAGLPPIQNRGRGWVNAGGEAVEPGVLRPPRMAEYFNVASSCPDLDMMGIWIFTGKDGLVTEFHQVLSRPQHV